MSPEYPDFPREEFEHRYARARALMAERNIDALFWRSTRNASSRCTPR